MLQHQGRNDTDPAGAVRYLTTGDPHFEYLFGGPGAKGIYTATPPGGTSVLIEGFSGTGKTILACQLCTQSLRANWPQGGAGIVYTLDQSPDDLRSLIARFRWLPEDCVEEIPFEQDVGRVPTTNMRLFLKAVPSEQTLADLWQRILRDCVSTRDDRAGDQGLRVVVVDAINTLLRLRDTAIDYDAQFRKLVKTCHEFNLIEILTLEKVSGNPALEEYVPSCVIELKRTGEIGAERALEVLKARNQAHFIGAHDFTIISGVGIHVLPSLQARSEGVERPDPAKRKPSNPINFGFQLIDDAIAPGLEEDSTTLLWGPPGMHKTELCAMFLAEGLHKEPRSRALFITFKIEPAAFLALLDERDRSKPGGTSGFVERTDVIMARDPFELPTAVYTRIKEKVEGSEASRDQGLIRRAGVFGLQRLTQLPAFQRRNWEFLEVLVSYLQSHHISTLLIDWPEPNPQGAVVVPRAIDLCSNEFEMRRDGAEGRLRVYIKRQNYQVVGKSVDYPE